MHMYVHTYNISVHVYVSSVFVFVITFHSISVFCFFFGIWTSGFQLSIIGQNQPAAHAAYPVESGKLLFPCTAYRDYS